MRPFALLLSFALLQLPKSLPQSLPPTRDQLFATFGAYVDALRAQAGIPGLSAAIIDDSGVAWAQAFGWQDLGSLLATRTDTPFHLDGLTSLLTTTLVLQCVEEGRITLDSQIMGFTPRSPDADATVRQVLTHTTGDPTNPVFVYRPDRLYTLAFVVESCTHQQFRTTVTNLLERLAMTDSVPGPDAVNPPPPAREFPTQDEQARYTAVLGRLATPYAVSGGSSTPSQYPATTLGAASGLISTVLDFAKFDVALRTPGLLLRSDTLAAAWRAPLSADGRPLPHGMGWFVQTYNGEPVVWEFGVGVNASSSLVLTLPARGVTLVLLANSDGLATPASLVAGDVTVSPFARVFLGLVVK